MSKALTIQLKAAFLLIVFGMNTLVGFACAMGVNMSFNTSHHHDEEAIEVHVHANGEKHHHHDKAEEHHYDKQDGSKKDDCCHDKVVKLTQTDKSVPQAGNIITSLFFTAFISSYYTINIVYASQVTISTKYFVLGHHPPISDIRIAIQSFLI